jgi:uncharacterized protein (TIGR02118 family)
VSLSPWPIQGRRLVFCLRRRAELSREEFQTYWRERHAPLVKERSGILGIVRYQQVHTVHDRRVVAVPAYDGVAELWFDRAATQGSPEQVARASAELLADERNFIDLADSPIWVADEVPMRTAPHGIDGELRLTACLKRIPSITRAQFRTYWHDRHGQLALINPDVFGFRHYVQLHTPDNAEAFHLAAERGAPTPYDGISEVWLDTPWANAERLAEVRAMIMEDEARFVDYDHSPLMLGRVEVVIGDPA